MIASLTARTYARRFRMKIREFIRNSEQLQMLSGVSLTEDVDGGVRVLDVDRHLVEMVDQLLDLLGL